MEKKNYKVYKHIFPNGKIYIGITCQELSRRWNNGNGYKNNEYMNNAIKKYGWENIKHEVLYSNLSKEEAESKEMELIKKLKANNKENGYNILDGGNVSDNLTTECRKKMSESQKKLWKNSEHRKRMSEAHTGKKMSEATKKKMAESNCKYWLGKKMPKEAVEKMRKKLKGRKPWNKNTKGIMKANKTSFKIGEVHSVTKKIKCLESGIIYNSINDASRELNLNSTCIINVCKGKQKQTKGLHFEYVLEEK